MLPSTIPAYQIIVISVWVMGKSSGIIESSVVSFALDAKKKISCRSHIMFTQRRYLVDGRL